MVPSARLPSETTRPGTDAEPIHTHTHHSHDHQRTKKRQRAVHDSNKQMSSADASLQNLAHKFPVQSFFCLLSLVMRTGPDQKKRKRDFVALFGR